jgi:hypothetical protein
MGQPIVGEAHAPVGRPSIAVERPELQNEERPTGSREGSEDAGSVGE